MDAEIFDIFDSGMNKVGTATRAEVHARGLWHQTFQCWIWNREQGEMQLVFQLRHRDKDTFPGLLDISCAGHLLAGETPQDGLRELREELGLEAAFSELAPCGVYASEYVMPGRFIDREFCHVFLLESDLPLASYRMQADEVSGLFRVRLSDLRRLLAAGTALEAAGIVTAPDGRIVRQSRRVEMGDLVPHSPDYFQLVFRTLETAPPAGSDGP